MKKIYIVCIGLFALMTQKSFGQIADSSTASEKQEESNVKKNVWWVSLKGGLSIPSLSAPAGSSEYSTGYKSILGPNIALSAEQRINKHFSIEYMIGYAAQGGQKSAGYIALSAAQIIPNLTGLIPGSNLLTPAQLQQQVIDPVLEKNGLAKSSALYVKLNGATSNLDYIQIPILAKYYAALSKRMNFYVDAGPFAGILLSAHQTLKAAPGTSSIYTDSKGNNTLIVPGSVMSQATNGLITTDYPVPELPGSNFATNNYSFYNQAHVGNIGIEGNIGFSYDLTPSQRVVIEGGGNYGFVRVQKDPDNGTDKIGAGTVRVGYAIKL